MPEDNETAVSIKHLYKSFKLPHEKHDSLKSLFVNIFKLKKGYEVQHVLKDISLEIKKGEFFGIVGRNGSGKSTLLKLLAGVYTPDKGIISVSGSLTPFIELGVGFNPELTGRENIFLNGALLGFSRKEMKAMYKDIVSFSELGRFMDQRLKNYSSGMQVRLAFAIAINSKSDILLFDEVLAVGDTAFQKKCFEYFKQIKKTNTTVILVTHEMTAVIDYCDRALLIDGGESRMIKDPETIAEAYREVNRSALNTYNKELESAQDVVEAEAKVRRVLIHEPGKTASKKYFKFKEMIEVEVEYEITKQVTNAAIDLGIKLGKDGPYYFSTNTITHKLKIQGKKGSIVSFSCKFKNIIESGDFYIATSMYNTKTHHVYARNRHVENFETGKLPQPGIVSLDHEVALKEV